MRISDWSSDVCSSDLVANRVDGNGELIRGERTINEGEAVIVRRIFREFADGKSPRAIARDLNAEGMPGPRGDLWMDTTIRGPVHRGPGIIHHELSFGRLVWDRTRHIPDTDTGRRGSRPQPQSEWSVQGVADDQ